MGGLVNILDATVFPKVIRPFFTDVVRVLYDWMAGAINLMYDLAKRDFGLGAEITKFTESFFMIFVIYMVFKLSLSFLSFLVNPDSFKDKSNGGVAFLKRFIISIVLLVMITPLFNLLSDIQTDILNEGIIDNFVFGTDTDVYTLSDSDLDSINPDTANLAREVLKDSRKNGKYTLYTVKLSNHEYCEGKSMITFSKGDRFSILVLRPFYQINTSINKDDQPSSKEKVEETNYCGVEFDPEKGISASDIEKLFDSYAISIVSQGVPQPGIIGALKQGDAVGIPTDAKSLLKSSIYNASVGDNLIDNVLGENPENYMLIDYNYIWALVVGFVVFLLIITYCFDVVIRAFTLFLYELIAPIPIISYVSPNKKDQEMLPNWIKKTLSVWAGLFIRIAILNFIMYFVPFVCKNINLQGLGFLASMVVIIGMLMFAKKLPKLLEEIIPGLKIGSSLELNPFKRISNEALGGKMVLGAGTAAAGMAVGGLVQTGTNALAFGRERSLLKKQIAEEKDAKKKAKLQHRLDHMNAVRFFQTTSGGLVGGARRGIVSGYKTGSSGSANIFKNLPKDVKDANVARNIRSAVRTYNNDVDDATREKIDKINSDFWAGAYGSPSSAAASAAMESDIKKAIDEAASQHYTWTERNILERIDREAGVKNTTGGYGFYEDKIEKLTQKIENIHQQELTLRQSVTNQISTDLSAGAIKMDARMLEELRNEMAEQKVLFQTSTSLAADANFNRIVNDLSSKYGISVLDIKNDYDRYYSNLGAITNLDNDQKELKAERKSYNEMMEARKSAQNK